MALSVATESAFLARKVLSLLKKTFGLSATVAYKRRRNLNKNNTFVIKVDSSAATKHILSSLGYERQDGFPGFTFPERLLGRGCCRRAYLRGAFLASGSVSDPEKTYHLEIVVSSFQHAQELLKVMAACNIRGKCSGRKGNWVVYVKDSSEIVTFLTVIGAVSAVLQLENVKVYKEMRNSINRLVNCEAANISKAAIAAMEQIDAIRLLESTIGLEQLEPELSELAKLRLAHPYASLRELGDMSNPRIGKSCVNHRMRKLRRLAGSIEKDTDNNSL
jgi:DNA-binding protein WhiA